MTCKECFYHYTTQSVGATGWRYWCDCPDTQINGEPREMSLGEAIDSPAWCAVAKLEQGAVYGPKDEK